MECLYFWTLLYTKFNKLSRKQRSKLQGLTIKETVQYLFKLLDTRIYVFAMMPNANYTPVCLWPEPPPPPSK